MSRFSRERDFQRDMILEGPTSLGRISKGVRSGMLVG